MLNPKRRPTARGTTSFAAVDRRRLRRPQRCAVVLLASLPLAAWSEVTINASATPQYEYESNVFDLPSGAPVFGTSDTDHSDRLAIYRGGLQTSYLWGHQNIYANVSGGEYRYQRFTELNHNEYSLDGGWKGAFFQDVSGSFDVSRAHTMVPFGNLLQQQQQIALQTEQRETASVQVPVGPNWRIEGSGYDRKDSVPLPQQANLNLSEKSGSATLRYVRNSALTGGISGTYSVGSYEGDLANQAPRYHQWSANAVASYDASGRSSFTGQAGYTQRSSNNGTDRVGGATGNLEYRRSLTGKTSIDLSLSRNVNATITNSGSEVDSIAAASVLWQATYRIGVRLGYSWTKRLLPGEGNFPGTDRTDRQDYTSLDVNYQAFNWLVLRSYANLQTRSSDVPGNDYTATIYGISFTASWKR